MASDEEEDYMSDTFLKNCGGPAPGLSTKHKRLELEREKSIAEANKKNAVLPKKKLEAVQRDSGLQTSISTQSKGFLLLQKMGYKPGTGIGKKGEGRLDPVPIELKSGRSGLGKDSDMKRKATQINNMRARKLLKQQRAAEDEKKSFLNRMSERYNKMSTGRDLRIAQNACFQLDKEQGISEPGETFFWPLKNLPVSADHKEEEEEDEGETQEGSSRIAYHNVLEISDDDLDDEDSNGPAAHVESFSDLEQLDILTRYLRNVYSYCIWCGIKFDDLEELESKCPGNSSDAHD